jgi:hypothetical protein
LNGLLAPRFLQHGRLFRGFASGFEFECMSGLFHRSGQAAGGLVLCNVIAAFGRLRLGLRCLWWR